MVEPRPVPLRKLAAAHRVAQALAAQRRDFIGERRHLPQAHFDLGAQGSFLLSRAVSLGLAERDRLRRERCSGNRLARASRPRTLRGLREMHGNIDEIAEAAAAHAHLAAPRLDARDQHRNATEAVLKLELRRLDPLGERDLLLAREELCMAHLPEIRVYQVARKIRLAAQSLLAAGLELTADPRQLLLVALLVSLLVSWAELVVLVLGDVERRTAAQGNIRRLQVQ